MAWLYKFNEAEKQSGERKQGKELQTINGTVWICISSVRHEICIKKVSFLSLHPPEVKDVLLPLLFQLRECKMLNQHKAGWMATSGFCRWEKSIIIYNVSIWAYNVPSIIQLLLARATKSVFFVSPRSTCFTGSKQGCNCNSIRDRTTGSDFLWSQLFVRLLFLIND